MTPRQLSVLRSIGYMNRSERSKMYWRTMDIGGTDASYHSAVLAQLTRLGFVERKPRSSRSFVYRITAKGRARLSELRAANG